MTTKLPKGVTVGRVVYDLHQENDAWDDGSGGQCLTIEVWEPFNPQARFAVITTERWAIDEDDIDALCGLLKNVVKGVPE